MSRSPLFGQLKRAIRIARFCDEQGLSTREGLARVAELEARGWSRRSFLKGTAGVAAGVVVGTSRPGHAAPGQGGSSADVAIVGAGMAGLVCADTLKAKGVIATIYDASTRAGGRVFSLGGSFSGPVSFPGQVVERGGEFIDTGHKTMIAYANKFNLAKEDVTKEPGEVFYHLDGQLVAEEVVVDEYRDFVDALHGDLQDSSGAPTADAHNAADIDLDNTSLAEYLVTRGAGANLYAAVEAAYVAEYGREIDEQSSLNFLLFIHADKRSKFTPFGVFSDERYHIVGGNQQIPQAIASSLSKPITTGHNLLKVKKTAAGRIELTFKVGAQTIVKTHDAVVLAVPFTVLRNVQLDPSLGLPAWKTEAIDLLGYGDNAKTMIGFNGPFWKALGANGASYSNLPNHQTTWETSPTTATASNAVLTDYAGGVRGANLSPSAVQQQVGAFLADLANLFPGAQAAAKKVANKYVAHLEHWPSNPLTLGSYTSYLPGQFTTIAGNEGKRVGNLHFAGEHANSFYEWQGFMEGACLSGIDAANTILNDIKIGAL